MYRTICTELWSDPKVRTLSTSAKLLFLYYITNPHSHYSGLYYQPHLLTQHETGIRTGFEGVSKALQMVDLVQFESQFEQIWVVKMYSYQGRGRNMDKGVAQHLTTLHNSSLITQFLDQYPTVRTYWNGTPFEPPYQPPSSKDSPVPVLLMTPNGIGEYERKRVLNGRACTLPDDFAPNDRAKELAKGQGQNVLALCAAFKDHHAAKGSVFKDWQAAFRTWLRNDVKFKEARR